MGGKGGGGGWLGGCRLGWGRWTLNGELRLGGCASGCGKV